LIKDRQSFTLVNQNNSISHLVQQETVVVPPQPTVVKIVRNSSQREANQVTSVKNETTALIKSE
jgi:hypothetical protein